MREHEYEPIPGLPEKLPEGEYIVWQGRPNARAVATRVFHARTIALYFVALVAVHMVYRLMDGAVMADILLDTAWQAALSAVAVGMLTFLARLYARGSIITMTNKRLVMRSGVALPMIVNIPWSNVKKAGLRVCTDGTGDILLTPVDDRRLFYFMLWPYVRPWHFRPVQPLLRGIEQPQAVARRLAEVIAEERETDIRPAPAPSQSSAQGSSDYEQPIPAL